MRVWQMKYRLAVIFLCLIIFPLLVFGRDKIQGKGPLRMANLYPFYLPFVNLTPERAKLLGPGRSRFLYSSNYGNTFLYDPEAQIENISFFIDTETLLLSMDWDYGLARYLDVGMQFSWVMEYGGFMDPFLQWWHHLFGFPNANRQYVADNQFKLYYQEVQGAKDVVWLNLTSPVSGFPNLTLKSKWRFLGTEDFISSLQVAFKIPLPGLASYLSSGKIDTVFNLLMEKNIYPFHIYTTAGLSFLGKPDNLELFGFNSLVFNFLIALEWMAKKDLSFLLQANGNSSPYMSEHPRLYKHTGLITWGVKSQISSNMILQLSMGEELYTFAATDFFLAMALSVYPNK